MSDETENKTEKKDGAKAAPEIKATRNEAEAARSIDAIYDIPVKVTTVLGKVNIAVSKLMTLKKGAVVQLDRRVGDSVDILVNRQLVARGELIVSDGRLGVTMTEIIKSDLTRK